MYRLGGWGVLQFTSPALWAAPLKPCTEPVEVGGGTSVTFVLVGDKAK
ncbi:hypothetical protein SAMN05421766_102184 [Zobellia uliginosa]|uniref:Uncharacterized protein n=1 Tax=Zobellia uliginosa TaxID=143224 RepID=A0ABY1KRH5_9FLAO|nr:hypothetical protein SAMN05421766_102184 [Zobellia uliginosa]